MLVSFQYDANIPGGCWLWDVVTSDRAYSRFANERRRYKVTPSLIGWAQAYNQP